MFYLCVLYIYLASLVSGCYVFNFTLSLYHLYGVSVAQPQVDLVSKVIFNYSSLYMVYLPMC